MQFRVGFGYDVHRLKAGWKCTLGGVVIDHSLGIVAHSDGDVLIHAICDALLGASALRDIGYQFPDTSDAYKGISSLVLLRQTCNLLHENGFAIGNVDSTICLQRPRIKNYIPEMITILADAMQLQPGSISVKATTTEHLGFVGREEGIAAYAVALIYPAK